MNGLDLGVGGGLRLGGGSSPMVSGASIAGSPNAIAAYGAGDTSNSEGISGIFGTTPGHLAIHSGIIAFALLILIRHSLPK